jgi:hypothetical protein
MNISELLSDYERYIDSEVEIEGFLVVRSLLQHSEGNIYISPDDDYESINTSIVIEQPDFIQNLVGIPPYGGGPVAYQDFARVTGKLCHSTNQSFPLALKDIKSASIVREGIFPII